MHYPYHYRRLVILGDLNTPGIDWTNGTASTTRGVELVNCCSSLELKQLVTFPTHRLGNILDLAFVPSRLPVYAIMDIPPPAEICDHYGIELGVEAKFRPKKRISVGKWFFNDNQSEAFQRSLSSIDFDFTESLNEQVLSFEQAVLETAKLFHNFRKIEIFPGKTFYPRYILRAIRKRDRCFRTFKK